MNADWVEMELGDFIELKRGYDLPKKRRQPGDIPIISSSGESDFHDEAKVKGPGVVTGRYGTIGEVFYVASDFWPLNTALYVKDFKGNDPLFVYYLLKTISYIDYSDKAAVPGINRNHLHKAIIRVPVDPVYQRDLAEKLWALDSKIELNRKTNQTLEQIAQAIFKSWFIDFEPTRTKIAAKKSGEDTERAAMAAISGKSLDQLDQLSSEQQKQLKTTAALFPDALVDSELGEIPEGWEASTLGGHFNVVMGQSPKGDTYNEDGDGILFFQGRRDFGFRYPTPRVYTTEPKRLAQAGDTLISVRAPVGDRNMANQECCLGRGVAGIRHKSGARSFTYAFIGQIESSLSDSGSDGTVFSSINKKELGAVNFVAPNETLIGQFESFVESIDERIEVNSKQINILKKLRDSLLPKLLSGVLSIPSNKKAFV